MVRIAIVGTSFGRSRCQMIANTEGAELVAVVGRDLDRAQALAAEFGCEATTDLDAVLARDDIDVIGVYTGTGAHESVAIAAAAAGKHVVVSKPVAPDLDSAVRIVRACAAAGVTLVVEFDTHYKRGPFEVFAGIEAGTFGPLIQGEYANKCHRDDAYYDAAHYWRADADLGGGCVLNQGVHAIEHMLWYQGMPNGVYAVSGTFAHDIPAEDAANAIFDFPNGSMATFSATTTFINNLPRGNYGGGTLARAQVHGPLGSATVVRESVEEWAIEDGSGVDAVSGTRKPNNVFDDLVAHLGGTPSHTLVLDERALDAVVVCTAVRLSAAQKRYVPIAEITDALQEPVTA